MRRKTKHQPQSPRILYFLERVSYWAAWFSVVLAGFMAIAVFREHSAEVWQRDAFYHTFYYVVWIPFTVAFGIFLFGAVPAAIAVLISRLLRWGLRLKEENASQAELIERLIEEQRARDSPAYLMDQDENDDMLPDEVYEQINRQR